MDDPWLIPVSRKKFMSKTLQGLFGLIGLGAVVGAYAYGWERNRLETVRIALALPALPERFKGAKLVHFSDLHLGHYRKPEDLQVIVDRINNEKPDLICFTGDLVEDSTRLLSAAIPVLSQLHSSLGKYAVMGNHDYRIGEAISVRNALASAGFEVLDNRNIRVDKEGSSIYIAGVDDVLLGAPDLGLALTGIPEDETVILLAHEPDFADETASHPVHLQLSGHSHGGQVRLPFIGHILTPKLARKYVQGMHYAGKNKMPVYTNRGIGTTQLPIRLFCRPELTVITLA